MQKENVLIPVFLAWYTLLAQPSNSSFLHYTTDQGLSNDHVTAIVKDHQGFLWVSTVNGLNRFDGRSFKTFYHIPNDDSSITDNDINGISIAPDGWLWIATANGLCKMDPKSLDLERIHMPENDDTIINDVVTLVAFDSKGMAWTTTPGGIYKINPETNQPDAFFKTVHPTLGWYGMYIDRQDRVWMMKDSLRRFDPATQELKIFYGINSKDTLTRTSVLSLVEDASGKFWAGTWGMGIWTHDMALDNFEKHSSGNLDLAMMLLPDAETTGRKFLWVGGGKSGLGIYYPDTKQFIELTPDPRDPFTHNNYLATTFFRDTANNNIWIGTEVGLEQYAPATIRFGRVMIPPENDMGQFSLVSGVVHDNTDPSGQRYYIALWGSGMFSWNKATGKLTRLRSTSKMTSRENFNVFQDSKGMIWGCLKTGAGRFNPRTGEWRDYVDMFQIKERNNLFWCGLEDKRGNIWYGSNKEGLFKYNDQTDRIELAFFKKELANDKGVLNIMDLSEDSEGRLWLAADYNGLIRYDPRTGDDTSFIYPDIAPLHCNTVVAAGNGRIYAGFYGEFLELDQDGKLLRHFNQQNGLKANRLNFIIEDLQGMIWFNSVYLLHRFDPVTGKFNYYGKPDGLFSNTMTDALTITPGGEVFIGFQNAFNFFYPDRLLTNLQPPPIAITTIRVMNKERKVIARKNTNPFSGLFSKENAGIERDSFLRLKPGEDFFEVEFAALNFNQQERNRYAYLLEGFNKDWVYTNRPVATFTNLDGGTYLLHMKAANNDGVWNEQGTTLAIKVNPSFYKTRWFPLMIVLWLSGIIAGFLWYRRQQRHRLEKFREVLARDLHDEMGSTLSSIRFFSEYADQQIGNDKPQVTPTLQRISQSATNLSESMQDIIWAMKTDHDHLEDLTSHMMEFGLRLLEARNIHFKTNINEDFSGRHLQPEVRRNIYLIFKEAINNAAKYSEAKEVEFTLILKKGSLCMQIRDNGKGFDMDSFQSTGGGNGLQNMRQRAADIRGTLEIYSNPKEGTKIELKVDI